MNDWFEDLIDVVGYLIQVVSIGSVLLFAIFMVGLMLQWIGVWR